MIERVARAPARKPAAPTLATGGLDFRRLMILAVIGIACGLVIPSAGPLKQPLVVAAFLAISGAAFFAVVRGRFIRAWAIIAFLSAVEPAFRAHARILPYLALDYVCLGICGLALVMAPRRRKVAWIPIVAYGAYIILEVTGSVFADSLEEARGIVIPSALMFVIVANSAKVRLTPTQTTTVLVSYVLGAVTLMGFALRAYAAGSITWTTESNFDASGGMPPNHITILLSVSVFACVVLAEDVKRRSQRLIILGLAMVQGMLMVLTFSRGGPVILVVCSFLYFVVLRPASMRTVVIIVVVALMGLAVAYSASEITGGKIVERYNKVDTSNRYTIAAEGWTIYLANPALGVGTSNFRDAIAETEFGHFTGAHNELIRAAAEHGTLGLLAWGTFIGSAFLIVLRSERHRSRRALRVVILVFAMGSSTFYNGLKLTMQPMLILLALTAFTAIEPAAPPRKQLS